MLSDFLGCEEEILTICAILSGRSPFYAPMEKKAEADKAKRSFAEDIPSDLYAAVRAYEAWLLAESQNDTWGFCRSNFISRQAMMTAKNNRKQLARDLDASKLEIFSRKARSSANRRASSGLWQQWGRVMGVLCASFGSHLARLDHNGSGKCRCPIYTKSHGRVKLFPSSISSPDGAARDVAARGTTYYIHRWGLYMEKVRNAGGINLYDISECSPLAISVCASGERTYSQEGDANEFVASNSRDGKVAWSDDEVAAMTLRRGALMRLADATDVSDVERVGARIEIEDIETRLGIVDLIGKSSGPTSSESDDINTRVLNFVVSALESNGGMYSMAGLRRMMKADMELYNAMGPVRNFAATHSSILSLEKLDGKWMFVLKPGATESLRGKRSGKQAGGNGGSLFYGPKQWVYFDMDDEDRKCIGNARKCFRDIVDASVSGRDLLPEESSFLDTLGWALEEEFTKSN